MDKLKAVAAATRDWVMAHKKFSGAIAILLVGIALGAML